MLHRMARAVILVALTAVLVSAAPANIAGQWQFTVELAVGTGRPLVTFKQDGEKITGTYEGRYGKSNLEGTVKENHIEFTVTVVAENVRTNGIVFSTDDKVLYVTNGGNGPTPGTIVAFDVKGPGMLSNRRDFATLAMGNGDGCAVDTEGRLYVTSNPGVQVFDKTGKYLGLIPTPRGVISVAFAGPDKKTLYVVGSGAEDANGQPIREGPQQTAATASAGRWRSNRAEPGIGLRQVKSRLMAQGNPRRCFHSRSSALIFSRS